MTVRGKCHLANRLAVDNQKHEAIGLRTAVRALKLKGRNPSLALYGPGHRATGAIAECDPLAAGCRAPAEKGWIRPEAIVVKEPAQLSLAIRVHRGGGCRRRLVKSRIDASAFRRLGPRGRSCHDQQQTERTHAIQHLFHHGSSVEI